MTASLSEDREWELRRDLAAVFRVAARQGWNEHIGNHNSVMLPGDEPTFLINPRGMLFQEITASSLIVCDLAGRVLRGTGQLRKVAFHIHARVHLRHPSAACVLHVHPRYLTALSLIEGGRMELSHHNDLILHGRIAYDDGGVRPALDDEEGDRIAECLDGRTVLIMRHHGVTVVGPTVHDAFDELFLCERTAMYQLTATAAGGKLARLPEANAYGHTGAWGDVVDARLHLDAWRRVLDREEPDYAA
jgi:ribulose-5-phosphate 4-epimerase/fuculose-1-phosphate aldolase